MENNWSPSNSYYGYEEYDYSSFSGRNSNPPRNEKPTPKGTVLKSSGRNQTDYKNLENYPEFYTEDQLWNLQRRAPDTSYNVGQHRPGGKLSSTNPQSQNNLPKKSEMPLKGILIGGQQENSIEGQRRNSRLSQQANSTTNERLRPKSPGQNYRSPTNRSNEDILAAFCGGEPMSELDDSQYYLINEAKNEQQNYDDEKNIYDDYSVPANSGSSYKDHNLYEYDQMNGDIPYDPSLRELASADLRDRRDQAFSQPIYNDFSNQEVPIYNNPESDYYGYQTPTPRPSSRNFSLNRYQNQQRRGNLIQPGVSDRRDIYKHVSEKLHETFTELKNAGISDKKEEMRSQRNSNLNVDRYSYLDQMEINKKSSQKFTGDYNNEKANYIKDGESYSNRPYKYQELLEENKRRSAILTHMDKYKTGGHDGLISSNTSYQMSKAPEVNSNIKRKVNSLENKKIDHNVFGETESFVHMHNEYKKNQSVPSCCVDVYNNYRKNKMS